MKSGIFKTSVSINEIFSFFEKKGMEILDSGIVDSNLKGKDFKYFEVSRDGGSILIASYKDKKELNELQKIKNWSIDYLLLVKNDLSEYVFVKYDEGTGKKLRLTKKRKDLNSAFLKKLDSINFDDMESFEKLFDRSEFIKEFYQLYCDAEEYLLDNIKGIPDEEEKELFAQLTLQRIMFLWFLQKKDFLDYKKDYFIDKFVEVESYSKNYYKDFLQKLFFKGLCNKEQERDESIKELIGDVPYLNGGLFIESEVELKYENSIKIENEIFYRKMEYPIPANVKNIPIINLMDCKDWTVDEKSGEVDKLDPEILGYIFEKSINQKSLGAVYTPEEITTYISKNAIYPYLVDKINEKFKENFQYENNSEKVFLDKLNREQHHYLFKIIKDLKILDPAGGSGHFLVDAISILEKIYLFLNDNGIIDCNKYRIREHIIKETLYGVDILPGAVEICKLRLFLALAETFKIRSDIHPLPNIEFNIRSGTSLVGFTSESQLDQNFITLGDIITTLKRNMAFLRNHVPEIAEQASNILLGFNKNFTIDPNTLFELRTELVKKYRNLHDHNLQTEFRALIYDITDACNKELNSQFYRRIIPIFKTKKELKQLKERSREKYFRSLKPFHWIMEYSEVFEKGGFPIVIGNPPWDIVKPSEKEFFSRYDPRLTKKLDKKKTREIIKELLKNSEIKESWTQYKTLIILEATYYTKSGDYQYQVDEINNRKVSGDLNLYKLFLERFHQLTKAKGYCGIVIPSGFYTDAGSKGLRRLLFDNTKLREIYSFENRKKIFDSVDIRFKFIIMTFQRFGNTNNFKVAFKLLDPSLLRKIDEISLEISWDEIKRLSSESYAIPEFRSKKDLNIVRKMYRNPTMGENRGSKWLTTEFHMTSDRNLFNTEKQGLILYEGKMIEQYDNYFGEPKYWIEENKALGKLGKNYKDHKYHRLAFRAIASNTNRRTMIATILPKNVFVGNKLILSKIYENGSQLISEKSILYLCGIFNSFIFDYLVRMKVKTDLSYFIINELPIPEIDPENIFFDKIVKNVAKLICINNEFDDLKRNIGIKNVKIDKNKRIQLIAEIENFVKDLYGLDKCELEHILDAFHHSKKEVEEKQNDLKMEILRQ